MSIVLKFGGASVKDAPSIINVANIIATFNNQPLVVVVSAIGKTTNALEKVVDAYYKKQDHTLTLVNEIFSAHKKVAHALFENQSGEIDALIDKRQETLEQFLLLNQSDDFNFVYDQIIAYGEILSSTLLHAYLNKIGLENKLVDAKDLIKTDNNYTDANIDWKLTQEQVSKKLDFKETTRYVTQGFLGGTSEQFHTTLGREGSDYTASILSYCLNASKMIVWKDVLGVYNADPKKFPEAVIIPEISFKEAIEMTFYGAQIIHPKTIKPLQNKQIPLYVKSFIQPDAPGTVLKEITHHIDYPPIFVLKEKQVLLNFANKDYSFLNENNLGKILQTFAKYSMRINIMQNTAISFMVLTDFKYGKIDAIIDDLKEVFEIEKTEQIELLTIRHFTQETINQYTKNRNILLTQKGIKTVHFLIKPQTTNF